MAVRRIVRYPHPALSRKALPVALDDPVERRALQALCADLQATVRDAGGLGLAAPQVDDPRAVFLMRDPVPVSTARVAVDPAQLVNGAVPPAAATAGAGDDGGAGAVPRAGAAARSRGGRRRGQRLRTGAHRVAQRVRGVTVAPDPTFTAVVNPRVLSVSEAQAVGLEGCLSLPDYRALVRRHTHLVVTYSTPDGATVTERLSGLPAIVFQHEFDHLQGIMHVNREVKAFVDRSQDEEEEAAFVRYVKLLATDYGEVQE